MTNRRYKLGYVWVVLVTIPYYICLFKGLDIQWWVEYAKQLTFWFGIVVGGLSATDIVWNIKEGFGKNGNTPPKQG